MGQRGHRLAEQVAAAPWSHWITISFTAPSQASVATRVSSGDPDGTPSATAVVEDSAWISAWPEARRALPAPACLDRVGARGYMDPDAGSDSR